MIYDWNIICSSSILVMFAPFLSPAVAVGHRWVVGRRDRAGCQALGGVAGHLIVHHTLFLFWDQFVFSFVGYCMEGFYQGYRGGYYLRNTPFLCGSILKLRKLWKIIAGDQLTSKVGEGRRHIKAWEFMGHGCYRTEVGTLQKRTRKESKIYSMITFHGICWYLKIAMI